jgi:integrase
MESKAKFKPDPGLKLMDQVRQVMRYHHYAYRTEKSYCDWIVRFIKFHGAGTHPRHMDKVQVEAFLSHLASHHKVSVSTQRQALNALVFLYRRVLDKPLGDAIEPVKARRQRSLPVVLTQEEVRRVFAQMRGIHLMMARLLYGSGMRLMECIRLRVKDLDFEHRRIYI